MVVHSFLCINGWLSFVGFLSNRAFCYSQLELHKHVIKDCDKALQIDANLLQPYILKGTMIIIQAGILINSRVLPLIVSGE